MRELDNDKHKDGDQGPVFSIENLPSRSFFNTFKSHHVLLSSLFCSLFLAVFSTTRDYPYGFLNVFLGYFFIFSAMIKVANLFYFTTRFSVHSFFSRWWMPYAYAFPFIQLFFGMILINGTYVFLISLAMLIFMGELAIASSMMMFAAQPREEDQPEEEVSERCQLAYCDTFLSLPVVVAESLCAVAMAFLNLISVVKQW